MIVRDLVGSSIAAIGGASANSPFVPDP